MVFGVVVWSLRLILHFDWLFLPCTHYWLWLKPSEIRFRHSIPQSHGCMEQYAMIIGDKASCQDYSNIATYFDSKRDYFMAGKFYFSAKMYSKVRKKACVYLAIQCTYCSICSPLAPWLNVTLKSMYCICEF